MLWVRREGVCEIKKKYALTLSLTEEELDIIQNWGFIVSTERLLAEKERELYFKITDVQFEHSIKHKIEYVVEQGLV